MIAQLPLFDPESVHTLVFENQTELISTYVRTYSNKYNIILLFKRNFVSLSRRVFHLLVEMLSTKCIVFNFNHYM